MKRGRNFLHTVDLDMKEKFREIIEECKCKTISGFLRSQVGGVGILVFQKIFGVAPEAKWGAARSPGSSQCLQVR